MPRVVIFDSTGGPEVLHVVDEPPGEPGLGEVRVRVEAAGLNRLDQLLRTGAFPRPVQLPHARIGCEGAGLVDAIGPDVTGLAIGQPVLIAAVPAMERDGTYADYTVVPASTVIPRPAGLDPVGAAALWVAYSTAYGALVETAGLRPGDHVLITAAGSSVGLAAIQLANALGAVPLAVTRRAARRAALLAAGAAAVIATDEEDLVDAARTHTDGVGATIILDTVLGPGLAQVAAAARPGGTLVTAGWLDPRPASMPMNAPLTIYRYMSFEHTLDPVVVRRMAAFLGAAVRAGTVRPVVDRVFGLDDVVSAHRYRETGDHFGKIVLTT